jgi:beta-galactosidase
LLLSHNAVIGGLGNKFTSPETIVEAGKTPRVSGGFALVLLDTGWPAALVRRFGHPAPAATIYRPFYHSYDQ